MDLHENSETNTVTATFELPGLQKENLQIELATQTEDGPQLTISGEVTQTSFVKPTEPREGKENSEGESTPITLFEEQYMVRERRFGKFSRTLRLPYGVKVNTLPSSCCMY